MEKNTQETKINFYEKVAEMRVAQVVEEEQELAAADNEIALLKIRTRERLETMSKLAEDGRMEERREIRNEVVVDNMRLVTRVLQKYGYFNADKFQNGCIGLLKAAETYNVEKEVPFANYAAYCIETEVRLAFKRVNRMFEGKAAGFLESLDAPGTLSNGDTIDKYETVPDEYAEQDFDTIVEEAGVDTFFYDIIIPVIEEYGTRAKDMDMQLWQQLEIQYFIELSMEQSQRQRLTFTEMAKQLDTTPQNIRSRHKKVMQLIREACIDAGYNYTKSATGRVRFSYDDGVESQPVRYRGKKHKKNNY